MSRVISVRTPAQIAYEVNTIKGHTDKMMLKNCVQIGRCLTEAKAVLPYGDLVFWLRISTIG